MTVGERIKARRKELGISADDLALVLGISRSTMFRYEKGDIEKVPGDTLEPIARALHTTPAYLMGWVEDDSRPASSFKDVTAKEYALVRSYRKASPSDRQIIDNIVARYPVEEIDASLASKIIPLFGTAAAAGPGEFDTGLPWEEYSVPADSGADFAVRISGDSMEPVLQDGQIALCAEKVPQIGDVTVMMVNGALLVKQFISDSYGNIYLRSLNRARRDLDLDVMVSGNDTVTCYGIVILRRRPALVDQ